MIIEFRVLLGVLCIGLIVGLYIIFEDKKLAGRAPQSLRTAGSQRIPDMSFVHTIARDLQSQLEQVIVGQKGLIVGLILGLFAGKHVLVQSLPGMAKTTAIKALAAMTGLSFGRIQGTPDLLPSDIIGLETIRPTNEGVSQSLQYGPIFANIILFDEVNRTTPKVQSALMQAMEERQVTIGHHTESLPTPFVVFATANPVGSRGVYELPEAQLDRFAINLVLDYPDNEREILKQVADATLYQLVAPIDFATVCDAIDHIVVDDAIIDMITGIIQKTRHMPDYITVGCSPRAGKDLLRLSKTMAYLSGRSSVCENDVKDLVDIVLMHRIIRNRKADKVHSLAALLFE